VDGEKKRTSLGEKIVKEIKRTTREDFSSEEKIRVVLNGLEGNAEKERLAATCVCTNFG